MAKNKSVCIPEREANSIYNGPQYRIARIGTRAHLVCYDGDKRIPNEPMCSVINRRLSKATLGVNALHIFIAHSESSSLH